MGRLLMSNTSSLGGYDTHLTQFLTSPVQCLEIMPDAQERLGYRSEKIKGTLLPISALVSKYDPGKT